MIAKAGEHYHRCECGFIWSHGNDCIDSWLAHVCMQCGLTQRWKYQLYPNETAVSFGMCLAGQKPQLDILNWEYKSPTQSMFL